jgi:WD40 repeat protein
MMDDCLVLIGDERFLEIWDLAERVCLKKLYMNVIAPIMSLSTVMVEDLRCLAIGLGDANPEIWVYRTDNWKIYACATAHTRGVTKLAQTKQWLISGSLDGNVCLYSLQPFEHFHTSPHISSI